MPVDSGDPIRGFYAIRRVRAETAQNAEHQAIQLLQAEEKYRAMIEATVREIGVAKDIILRLEAINEVSWFAW